jgi:hypothetical protein
MIAIGLPALRLARSQGWPLLWSGRQIDADEADRLLSGEAPAAPVEPPAPTAMPLPPTADQIAARVAACRSCGHYRAGADTCGLCGCGAVVSQRAGSPLGACPGGRW